MASPDLETVDSEAHRRPFDPAHSAGLFVGVSEFEDARIREVPYAVDDAVDLAHLFVVELGLITPELSVLALSGEPKKRATAGRLAALLARGVKRRTARPSDVYRYLGELGRSTGERGLFVVTVASHGFTDQGGDFIVAWDSVPEHRLRSGVSVDELFDEVARAQAPRRLVLLDTCRDRFSQFIRGAGDGPMSASFAAAIARASGQVVLSGAAYGGYSYDDLERGNGVFSGAVIDGLRGEAAAGPDGWITVHTLAVFLQERVSAWVKHHRPSHVVPVQGIGQRIDGPGSEIPLAPHPAATKRRQEYRARRTTAEARLGANLGGVLTGTLIDQVLALLPADEPNERAERVLAEVEALDDSENRKRSLRDLVRELRGITLTPEMPKAEPELEPVSKPRESGKPVREPPSPSQASPAGPKPDLRDLRRRRLRYAGGLLSLLAVTILVWAITSIKQREPQPPLETKTVSNLPLPDAKPATAEAEEKGPSIPVDRPAAPITLPPSVVAAEAAPSGSGGSGTLTFQDRPVSQLAPPAVEPAAGTVLEGPLGIRMRFVPGGAYWIGSPEDENGRYENERRHQVELTRGFWLAETEVTQRQWKALPAKNPSHFTVCGDDCPVESVSWWEAVTFANLVSDRAGLERCYDLVSCRGTLGRSSYECQAAIFRGSQCAGFRLPSEAEWEVATRAVVAGSENPAAIYSGRLRILGDHHGPGLDPIAWYGGNSGWTYNGGHDCSGWPEKQFSSSRCGPHPVGKKRRNSWGFADLLGNVFEWTGDADGDYPSALVLDPLKTEGTLRIIRGGAWDSLARDVRAASRGKFPPSDRDSALGFRLAQGQVAAPN